MIGLDTNVVVRLVTRDDAAQTARATEVFRSGRILLPKTVLLETEWVLRHAYGLDRAAIHETFCKLLGYRPLQVEDRATVTRAVDWYRDGMDFADALHLASCERVERFVTFDRKLVQTSAELQTRPAVAEP